MTIIRGVYKVHNHSLIEIQRSKSFQITAIREHNKLSNKSRSFILKQAKLNLWSSMRKKSENSKWWNTSYFQLINFIIPLQISTIRIISSHYNRLFKKSMAWIICTNNSFMKIEKRMRRWCWEICLQIWNEREGLVWTI